MRRRRSLATLLASVALHGGALLAVLLFVSRDGELGALFIDLTEWAEAGGASGAGFIAAPPPAARRASAGAPSPARSVVPMPGAQPSLLRPAPLTPATPDAPGSAESPAVAADAVTPAPLQRLEAREPGPGDATIVPGVSSLGAPSPGAGTANGALASGPGEGGAGTREGLSSGPGARRGDIGSAPDVSGGFALAVPGIGLGAPGAEYGPYLGKLRQRVQGSLKYPLAARRRGLAGTVNIEIVIRPDGTLSVVSVAGSSAHLLLDAAAVEAVRSLAPEPFPPDVLPRTLRVRLPVVFALQEQ